MDAAIQKIGGRKFIAAIFSVVSATSLVWFHHISDGVYSAVMLGTVAAYITGNVVQKVNTGGTK